MDNNYNQENPYMQPNQGQGSPYMQPNQGQGSPYMQPNQGQENPYMQPNPGQGMPYMQPPKKGCAFGIAALVVGILSMTLCCVGGSVMGIAGIILGIVALCRKESKYGLAIGGIVTSVFGVLIGIYMIIVIIFSAAAYDQIKDMDENEMREWLQERLDALESEGISGLDDLQSEAGIAANENHCCLVLHNESLYSGGETDYEPNDRHYMGFYYEGYYDAANMESAEYAAFQLLD